MHWRRKWQHTPVFLPGESQGWGSLVGCHLWGHTKSEMMKGQQQQQRENLRMSIIANTSPTVGWKKNLNKEHMSRGKAMATHSSSLARKIPWMEEPGRLRPVESLRVGHDWATSLSLFTFRHWRRKWQHTPVFLPGESQGWGSLWAAIYGVAELDMTEVT